MVKNKEGEGVAEMKQSRLIVGLCGIYKIIGTE